MQLKGVPETGNLMPVAILSVLTAALLMTQSKSSFGIEGPNFMLNGKPFVIRSGEMHYPRVPRAAWRHRFKMLRAMGMNTVCTYVFWNLHEAEPGKWDFSGNLDLRSFIKEAEEEGLYAIVRPGPYICTEWDWGGFPYWLANIPGMKVRHNNEPFLKASDLYLKRVLQEVGDLQITRGGPIIMFQLENEYGSFGRDKDYLRALQRSNKEAGVEVPLFTSDGPSDQMLAGGTLPDVASVINFGGGAKQAFDTFAKFRQNVPRMCGEFWAGWFDHWGKQHAGLNTEGATKDLEWFLANDVSFNVYMAHGGTNFGFMNGANYGGKYDADTSSYDYAAAIDEAGRATEKFWAFRKAIEGEVGPLPSVPRAPAMMDLPPVRMTTGASIWDLPATTVRSDDPMTMEALNQAYGFVRYSTTVRQGGEGELAMTQLRDRAQVFVNGKLLGIADRRKKQSSVTVTLKPGDRLDLLVENMGRVNFGQELVDEGRKGITDSVTLNGVAVKGWTMFSLPFTDFSGVRWGKMPNVGPALFKGSFDLGRRGSTFLDMRGWGKGNVWVNGHNLGRYWSIGPQQSLYLPESWLQPKGNEIIVLELEDNSNRTVTGSKDPVFYTVPEFSKTVTKQIALTEKSLLAKGSFTPGSAWQTVSFAPIKARYVCFEALSSLNGQPFGGAAELRLVDANGEVMDPKGMSVAYVSSDEKDAESGEAANVLDNQPTTIWHSSYSGGAVAPPHRLVLDLGEVRTISGLRYLPRQESSNTRVKDYRIYGTEIMWPLTDASL